MLGLPALKGLSNATKDFTEASHMLIMVVAGKIAEIIRSLHLQHAARFNNCINGDLVFCGKLDRLTKKLVEVAVIN